jgi:predicted  nucleic acid-binding Zn-ribbon protein
LADVAHLEKEIQFFSNLATREVRDELPVLEGKLNKIRNRKDESRSSLYGISDDVSTSILTQKTVSEFRSKVAEAKKAKQKLQDELLELNVRTTITLDSASVDVLRFEDLV